MAEMKQKSIIGTIDQALALWYEQHSRTDYYNAQQKGRFNQFCEDCEFDSAAVEYELEQTADDCAVLEFDDNFPGIESHNSLDQILQLLIQCRHEGPAPDFKQKETAKRIPEFSDDLFKLLNEEKIKIQTLYKSQCTKDFIASFLKDHSAFLAIAIGYKLKFPYIQNLVDDYSRCRLTKHMSHEVLTLSDWITNTRHFAKIQMSLSSSSANLIQAAVNSYIYRICPMLQFYPQRLIDASIKETAEHIENSIEFISSLLSKGNICPFQLDVVIGYKGSVDVKKSDYENISDTDNSDIEDEQFDEKIQRRSDKIGDIIQKLKANGLTYHQQSSKSMRNKQPFSVVFEQLKTKAKLENEVQGKRLIVFIDKRYGTDNETITMFQPPSDCSTIPYSAVFEWYFASSAMCLIPAMGYKIKKMMVNDTDKNASSIDVETVHSRTSGIPVLTLSFHVRGEDEVACYMYINGQYTRFMATDIVNILPCLFDQNEENNQWIAQQMKIGPLDTFKKYTQILKDVQFSAFRAQQCGPRL